MDDLPLLEELDQLILMHRNAHFAGSWAEMLRYYEAEGIGCADEIPFHRIEELAIIERDLGQDLTPLVCSVEQQEEIQAALTAYAQFRKLYEIDEPEARRPQLLANLLLAEENELESAKELVLQEGSSMVPILIDILHRTEWLNPLYPGYGAAPARAAECLGELKDQRAVVALFELLVQLGFQPETDFDIEASVLEALHQIGTPAQEFLTRIIARRPIGPDHLPAMVALCRFGPTQPLRTTVAALQAELSPSSPLAQYCSIFLEEPNR
ncbi:MAG: hypothetical protein ACOYKZ_07675 [Chlamydiia bacterium]